MTLLWNYYNKELQIAHMILIINNIKFIMVMSQGNYISFKNFIIFRMAKLYRD